MLPPKFVYRLAHCIFQITQPRRPFPADHPPKQYFLAETRPRRYGKHQLTFQYEPALCARRAGCGLASSQLTAFPPLVPARPDQGSATASGALPTPGTPMLFEDPGVPKAHSRRLPRSVRCPLRPDSACAHPDHGPLPTISSATDHSARSTPSAQAKDPPGTLRKSGP